MQRIGVMGAIPEEVDRLTAGLTDARQEEYAGVVYHSGQRGGRELVVCCAGMGKANAASVTQVLISHFGVEAIWFSGIAGSMTDTLPMGGMVVGAELCYHDAQDEMLAQSAPFTSRYKSDLTMVAALAAACKAQGLPHKVGRIATGDRFVGDPTEKERIRAACNPDCVEMEGAAVAQIALRNNIPFVVLRTMSDNADAPVDELNEMVFEVQTYIDNACAVVFDALARV